MNKFTFPLPTDKMPGAWHGSYPEVYERILAPIKNTTGTVLEIGVDGGGSLMAYREWFPNARVIGMDISPAPKLEWNSDFFHFQGNAYEPEGVMRIHEAQFMGKPLTVAIDDGPHTLGSQQFFVENYLPMLAQDGIGIVEDVQHIDHIAKLHDKLPKEFFGYGVDLRWQDSRYDSLLFVAHRK